jgi:hypothetical protein
LPRPPNGQAWRQSLDVDIATATLAFILAAVRLWRSQGSRLEKGHDNNREKENADNHSSNNKGSDHDSLALTSLAALLLAAAERTDVVFVVPPCRILRRLENHDAMIAGGSGFISPLASPRRQRSKKCPQDRTEHPNRRGSVRASFVNEFYDVIMQEK